ncbi:hypothetical protein ACFX11_000354 [Malus domestica]
MDIAPDILKSSDDLIFPEMDSLLEFDYPTSVHTISGSGACNDSVVPVQPDPIPPPSFNMNYNVSGPADHNCFDLDFFRSKLYSSFNTGSDDLHMTSKLRKSFSPLPLSLFPQTIICPFRHLLLQAAHVLEPLYEPLQRSDSKLVELDLSASSHSGSVPDALSSCSLLESLDISGNNFSSELPVEILMKLANLKAVSLSFNNFYGTLPDSLSKARHIGEFGSQLQQLFWVKPSWALRGSWQHLEGAVPSEQSV